MLKRFLDKSIGIKILKVIAGGENQSLDKASGIDNCLGKCRE
jgi:hypothetical protein